MANSSSNAAESALRIKIADLERELRSEKDSFILLQSQTEVAKFVARQEVEKCRRNCSGLEDRVLRLEEDCKTLREREVRDRERIRSLLREIEMNEREFKEKFIELKVEIRDLECGRKRALDEADDWKKKCAGLETERLSLVEEVARLKRKEEDCVVTPEQRRIADLVASDTESEGRGEDEEDRIPLRNYKRKRVAEVVANGGKKGDEGLKEVSTSRGEACEVGNIRANGNGMCVETAETADHANADERVDHANANEVVDHANANEAADHANEVEDEVNETADDANEGADNATEVVGDATDEPDEVGETADEMEVKDAQILMEEAETKDSQISEDEKDAQNLAVPDNGAQEVSGRGSAIISELFFKVYSCVSHGKVICV